MKKAKRVMALVLSFAMVLTGIQFGQVEAKADTTATQTDITSLEYDVTVANSGDTSSFTWETTNSGWAASKDAVAISGDGDYKITPNYSYSAASMINLGFVTTIADSEMTITVNNIIVNGIYTVAVNQTLQAGTNYQNGLKNIWSGLTKDQVIYGDAESSYFAYDGSNISFYVVSQSEEDSSDDSEDTESSQTSESTETTESTESTESEVAGVAISKLTLNFEVSKVSSETSFTWESTNSGWGASKDEVALNGNGTYSLTPSYPYSADSMINLGFVDEIADSQMEVKVTSIVVNDTYTVSVNETLQPGVQYKNGLKNIWSGLTKDQVIYGDAEKAYFAYDGSAISFYAVKEASKEDSLTISQQYVKDMGQGWNLGNSFESFDTDLTVEDLGETCWGNPKVTKELIKAVKAKGYDTIRIPMTLYRRYVENEDGTITIDSDWLARYKEVIKWCLEEDLHVQINIHNESWLWLSGWDGDKTSVEYTRFKELWTQLATYMADLPEEVCFETINEPTFEATGSITAQDKLDMINQVAYDAIRGTAGNEKRMIVIPLLKTDYSNSTAAYNFITSLNDEYVIATFHYYSEWVFSANLGRTGFDETLYGDDRGSARNAADTAFEKVNNTFCKNGIGVIVGEWGLLGYDAGTQCNELGEELKYYDYINYLGNKYGMCLIFWDNGSGIDRTSGEYNWKKTLVGEMLEASMSGRSSYATGLDTLYFSEAASEDVEIPLTLNGNSFTGIEGLTEGEDYTYDEASATITLSKQYVNSNLKKASDYGQFAELVMKFSSGANWHEYLVYYAAPVASTATGTKSEGISVPMDFNGAEVRRVTAYQASGKVGPNSSWWNWLQRDSSYSVDYDANTITLSKSFFADSTISDGLLKLTVEYFDGQTADVWFEVSGDTVTSDPSLAVDTSATLSASNEIYLYAGETEIPSCYIQAPEGAKVYGTYANDDTENGYKASDYVTMSGWPAVMTFGQKAQEGSIEFGIQICYMDKSTYASNLKLHIVNAPVVNALSMTSSNGKKGFTGNFTTENLDSSAVVTYKVADKSIATVASDGTVTALANGSTKVTVTVEQYGRTDSYESSITVSGIKSQTKVEKAVEKVVKIVKKVVSTVVAKVKETVSKSKVISWVKKLLHK